MAKSSRPKRKHGPAHGSQPSNRARNAAGSNSWSAIAFRSEPFGDEQSRVSRDKRPAPRPSKQRPRGAVPSLQALFGTWELPTTAQRPQKKPPAAVSTCVARHQRREVLFATQRTGAGSTARKIKFTNRRCK